MEDAAARSFFDPIPYARFLGLRAEAPSGDPGGEFRGVMPFADHLVGNPTIPALHGGAIGAFLELTAIAELARRTGGRLPRTIGVTVEYLRSGRARDTYARVEVRRMGRRIASLTAEAWQDDPARPIALLSGRFLLPQGDAAPDASRA